MKERQRPGCRRSGRRAPDREVQAQTLAAQALGWWEPSTRGLVPAIHPATTYERAADGSYPSGHSYTRDENPTYEQAEALLAALEGGEQALLFASGMAAAAAVLDSLDAGAHVVAGERMYWALRGLLERLAREGRIRLDLVPTGDLGALARAVRRGETKLVWVETPANPTCEVTDLEAAAAIAQQAGAVIAVDSTVATPVHTQPIALGCDLVFHSATKMLNGHSDVLAGALVCARRDELWSRIRRERASRGAVLGPFEAWLLLRGMRTLYLRAAAASRGAQRVAEALQAHPNVSEVFYPGLPDHPEPLRRRAPDEGRLRRAALVPRARRRGGGARRRGAHPRDQAGDVAGRRREPDRASRVDRRRRVGLAGRSAAALGRDRGRG